MFWTVTGFAQSSPIEGILDKGSYSLAELLDEDDLIQECKSLNARLIHYLKQPATVKALLRYIVEPPPAEGASPSGNEGGDGEEGASGEDGEGARTDDPKRAFKYPYAACEVFCCEVDSIFSTLVEDETLMGMLFSLLDAEAPLDAMRAGYFARVLNVLLLRKTAETMAYLQGRADELLPKLLRHIGTTSVGEALVRLVGADEQSRVFLNASSLRWLLDTPLLQMLLDMLDPGRPADDQRAAADVLTAVAETQLSPLAAEMAKPEVLETLFERAFAVDGCALVPALNVCVALLEPRSSAREAVGDDAEFLTPQLELRMKTEAVFALAGKVGRLVAFLDEPPPPIAAAGGSGAAQQQQQDTPYGRLQPPLGTARLKVVELIAALARSGMRPAETALLEGRAVRRCMDLFAAYPFHNLLHKHVGGMLATLLEGGSDETVAALLAPPIDLPAWLAGLPETHAPGGDGAAVCTKPWRAGYMGHVTKLGQTIESAGPKRPAVAAALASDPAWAKFASGYLSPTVARESPEAWVCGRPNSMDMAGLDSEPDDAFDNELDLEPMPGTAGGAGGAGSPQIQRRDLCGVPDYRYAGVASTVTQDDEPGVESPVSSNSGDDVGSSSDDDDGFGVFAGAPPPAPTPPVAATAADDAQRQQQLTAAPSSVDEEDAVLTAAPAGGGDGGGSCEPAGGQPAAATVEEPDLSFFRQQDVGVGAGAHSS